MNVTFDLRKAERAFAGALAQMAQLTGLNSKQIVLGEAGVILKTCSARTKVAPMTALQKAGAIRTLRGLELVRGGEFTVNAGIRGPYGRVFMRKKSGQGYRRVMDDNFKPLNQHYTDAAWTRLITTATRAKEAVKKGIASAKLTSGLARQSWIQIADRLGIALENVKGGGALSAGAIAKARLAAAKGAHHTNNGTAQQEAAAHSYFVTLINRLPYGRRIGLDRTLTFVIAGRVQFFATSVAKGFRGSLEETAKRFPGWTVK